LVLAADLRHLIGGARHLAGVARSRKSALSGIASSRAGAISIDVLRERRRCHLRRPWRRRRRQRVRHAEPSGRALPKFAFVRARKMMLLGSHHFPPLWCKVAGKFADARAFETLSGGLLSG